MRARAIDSYAADLAAGDLRTLGIFDGDCSAKVHLRRIYAKQDSIEWNFRRYLASDFGFALLRLRRGAGTSLGPGSLLFSEIGDGRALYLLGKNSRRQPNVKIAETGGRQLEQPVRAQLFLGEIIKRGGREFHLG